MEGPMTALRAMADFASRANLALRAGLAFDGDRDLFKALGFQRNLTCADYRGRFLRGGVAARVVDAYPKATWRGGAEIVEDEDPDIATAFEAAWDELNARLMMWSAFNRVDILAGLGRYAGLLIGMPGNLDTEVTRASLDQILYLAAYAEDELLIDALEEDTANERFGMPLFYRLRRQSKTRLGKIDSRIHWSRILHVADGMLDDRTYGTPRLERVWNDCDSLEKVVGGGSEAFWLRVHQGMIFKVDPTLSLTDPQKEEMKDKVDEFVNGMRRTLMMKGVEAQPLGTDVTNFGPPVASLLSLISGATGIPQRILLGSERGQLASTQDRENWDARVDDRRVDFAGPMIVHPFIDRLITFGALPKPTLYEVRWPEIESLDEKGRSEVASGWAGLNTKAGGTVVTPAEIRDRVLRLEPLTPAQLAEIEAAKIANTPPALQPGAGMVDKNGNPIAPDPNAPNAQPGAPPAGRSAAGRPKEQDVHIVPPIEPEPDLEEP